LTGGKLIQFGKRRMIIVFNSVIIIASVMSIFKNWELMLVGRGLFSFASGALVTFNPKVLGETIPANIFDYGFGASTNMFINTAIMFTMFLGMGYPSENDPEIKTTNFWKAFYVSPIPIMVIALLMNFFVHK